MANELKQQQNKESFVIRTDREIDREIERRTEAFRMEQQTQPMQRANRLLMPGRMESLSQYGSTFSSRLSWKKRETKFSNKRSRLYQKKACTKLLFDGANKATQSAFQRMRGLFDTREVGCRDGELFHSLSCFTREGQQEEDQKLLDAFLGKTRDAKGEVQGQDLPAGMDMAADRLLAFDLRAIDLTDELAFSKSTEKLEALTEMIGAWDRLTDRYHDAYQSLPAERRKRLEEHAWKLRSVAAYYVSKKELMTDHSYRQYYNDELSMNVPEDATADQLIVAKKLMKTWLMARLMMSVYDTDREQQEALGQPALTTATAKKLWQEALKECTQNTVLDTVRAEHARKDYLAEGLQLDPDNMWYGKGESWKYRSMSQGGDFISGSSEEEQKNYFRREDIAEIKTEVCRRLGVDAEWSAVLANPLTGYEASGVQFTRVIPNFTKQLSAGMSKEEIIRVFTGLFAPATKKVRELAKKPEKDRTPEERKQIEEINREFVYGMQEYKRLQLDAYRRMTGSFGLLLTQLTSQDSLNLLQNYGQHLAGYVNIAQDVEQMFHDDSQYYDKKGADAELVLLNRSTDIMIRSFTFWPSTSEYGRTLKALEEPGLTPARKKTLEARKKSLEKEVGESRLDTLKILVETAMCNPNADLLASPFMRGPMLEGARVQRYQDARLAGMSEEEQKSYLEMQAYLETGMKVELTKEEQKPKGNS